MIFSPAEFARLRYSDLLAEQQQATHDDATIDVWLGVIEQFPDLRSWVAHNKTVPIEILTILSSDPDSRVRSTVAMKRKLTPKMRKQLASDIDASVRNAIACNAKCEVDILKILSSDPEEFVRESALKGLSRCSQ